MTLGTDSLHETTMQQPIGQLGQRMKFMCTDGVVRDFESVGQRLIRLGFAPELLTRDGDFAQVGQMGDLTLMEAFQAIRQGRKLKGVLQHYTRRSRASNPIQLTMEQVVRDDDWLVLLPWALVSKQGDWRVNADLITKTARFFYAAKCRWVGIPQMTNMESDLGKDNARQLQPNVGYQASKVCQHPDGDDFVRLRIEDGKFLLLPLTILGRTAQVYVLSSDGQTHATSSRYTS